MKQHGVVVMSARVSSSRVVAHRIWIIYPRTAPSTSLASSSSVLRHLVLRWSVEAEGTLEAAMSWSPSWTKFRSGHMLPCSHRRLMVTTKEASRQNLRKKSSRILTHSFAKLHFCAEIEQRMRSRKIRPRMTTLNSQTF